MSDPKEALERLKVCAESLACNAANLRADTLPGEANADFYIRTADEHEQWSKDLLAIIAKQEGLERDYADLKSAIGGAATEEQTLRLIIRGYLAQQTAESKAEGLEREVEAMRQVTVGPLSYTAMRCRAEAAESKLSALEEALRPFDAAFDNLDPDDKVRRAWMVNVHMSTDDLRRARRALLHPAVPVEPACAHQWFGKTSRAGQRWQCALCRKITDQDPEGTSSVPPSQGAEKLDRENERRVADLLRDAYTRVQADKKAKGGPITFQPIWDVVNLVPEVLYCLDRMAEFERDCEADEDYHPDVTGPVEALKQGDLSWLRATIDARRLDIRTTNSGVASLHNDRINRIDAALIAFQSRQEEG